MKIYTTIISVYPECNLKSGFFVKIMRPKYKNVCRIMHKNGRITIIMPNKKKITLLVHGGINNSTNL